MRFRFGVSMSWKQLITFLGIIGAAIGGLFATGVFK